MRTRHGRIYEGRFYVEPTCYIYVSSLLEETCLFHVIFFFGERFFLEDLFNILVISALRPDRLIFCTALFFFFYLIGLLRLS